MRALDFSLGIGILALLGTCAVSAQSSNRFAGVFEIVADETLDANGRLIRPSSSSTTGDRFGYIAYDPAGYMGVTLAWHERPKFAREQPTAEEAAAAMRTYNSYWGSFAVNEARGIVTHQTFGALSPAFAGTDQEREFSFSGNRLTLRPPATAEGTQRILTWERVPDSANPTPNHDQLRGFWKLIAWESRTANGELRSSFPGATGFIVYTASGHVMVHLMQPYRRRNVAAAPTPEETLATYSTYESYFGPYTFDVSGQHVIHHLASHLDPRLVGTDRRLSFDVSGTRMTQKSPVTKNGNGEDNQEVFIWERLSE